VGYIQIGFSAQQPLTVHWDGNSWSLVQTPSTSPTNNDVLWAVTALAADNVWAVGSSTDRVSGNYSKLIEHWDGSAWSTVSHPEPAGSSESYLYSTKATSSNELWAIGAYLKDDTVYQTLIERYSNVPCLTPSGVVSRKNHGTAGTFDVD